MTIKKKQTDRGNRGGVVRPPAGKTPGYTPRVVVKFREDINLPYEDGILDRIGDPKWKRLINKFRGLKLRRLFTSVTPDRINELVTTAQAMDSSYRQPDFLAYFIVDCQSAADAHQIAAEMSKWTNVRKAYFDPPGSEPGVNPDDGDEKAVNQVYLNEAAKGGIDAEYAWTVMGGDGAGQSLIDLERGWDFKHADLKKHFEAQNDQPLYGTIRNNSVPHGTSVLGVICGVDNQEGIVGITPNLSSVQTVSYWGDQKTRPDAIMAAIDKLEFGRVLLLEAQLGGMEESEGMLPLEVQDAEFDAIRLATALGIVVIEAAGNEGAWLDEQGSKRLKRDSEFEDSGAIMVGAASVKENGDQIVWSRCFFLDEWGSNWGSRIDCFAQGTYVLTTVTPNDYTKAFDGTSSASAIVAGAALAVQGVVEKNLGFRLDSWQMRQLLIIGTTAEGQGIGVMPDLRKIINAILGNTTDTASAEFMNIQTVIKPPVEVYIRDFADDPGGPPVNDSPDDFSNSPDIIVSLADAPAPELNGADNGIGSVSKKKGKYVIRLRVRNRGIADAQNVSAKVFCVTQSTLLTPSKWKQIGTVTFGKAPAGNAPVMSKPIKWPKTKIPKADQCYLIALADKATAADYLPTDFKTFDNLKKFIRRNNKAAWRKIDVTG